MTLWKVKLKVNNFESRQRVKGVRKAESFKINLIECENRIFVKI